MKLTLLLTLSIVIATCYANEAQLLSDAPKAKPQHTNLKSAISRSIEKRIENFDYNEILAHRIPNKQKTTTNTTTKTNTTTTNTTTTTNKTNATTTATNTTNTTANVTNSTNSSTAISASTSNKATVVSSPLPNLVNASGYVITFNTSSPKDQFSITIPIGSNQYSNFTLLVDMNIPTLILATSLNDPTMYQPGLSVTDYYESNQRFKLGNMVGHYINEKTCADGWNTKINNVTTNATYTTVKGVTTLTANATTTITYPRVAGYNICQYVDIYAAISNQLSFYPYSGVMGLGLNQTRFGQNYLYNPLFSAPQWGFIAAQKPTNKSTFILGGVNLDYLQDNKTGFIMYNISGDKTSYKIPISNMSYVNSTGGLQSIAQSGATQQYIANFDIKSKYIVVPPSVFGTFTTVLTKQNITLKCNSGVGRCAFAGLCQSAKGSFGNFAFSFNNGTTFYSIPWQAYFQDDVQNNQCTLLFQQGTDAINFVIGTPFFKHFYTLFDIAQKQIGIALVKNGLGQIISY